MKRLRSLSLFAIVAAGFATVALIGQAPAPTGVRMSAAAQKFLAALTPDQQKKATFDYDSKTRLAWFFTPQQNKQRQFTRVGVRMEELNPEQKLAALDLLKSGLSKKGFEQATTIMSLEGLLNQFEGSKGAMVRNTGWYFISIFGKPSDTGNWGWRFEGHHMSVNYTLHKGEVVTATPLMFGANPADVKSGDRKGLRTLPGIEDDARALITSLTPEQNQIAKQPTPKNYNDLEIKENNPRADVGVPVGISAKQLTPEQRKTLMALITDYADRLPEDLAAREKKKAIDAAPEKLFFAYTGSPKPGEPYTYRVYGPAFVIEFLNVQKDSANNPANHIHSAWRCLPGDFGLTQ